MSATQLPLAAPAHRNQQLFSDYYLNSILPQRTDWQELMAAAGLGGIVPIVVTPYCTPMGVILTATAALVKQASATASAEVMMRRFGEKLRALRLQRGLTMRALADMLGLKSHGFIGDLESGRKHPSLEFAIILADYFGVSVDQLARDELEIDP